MIRQPIITVLGHVDHGKTTLLDYIRGSTVAAREAGAITQHVGATQVPIDHIKAVCKELPHLLVKLTLPGLLFIDTPGHEVFTNLRKRGGSIADLSVLVIDINQGIQPQTKEAVEILKTFKVPFIIAATKVDMLPGWRTQSKLCSDNSKNQLASTREIFEKRLYGIIGQMSELGFNCNLWTDVTDYKKEISVVPLSAKTGEGVAEMLALLAGLAQKFLANKLEVKEGSAKGTILEIKEEKGMGTTADVIVYEGEITSKDYLAIGGINEVIETSVKALLEPLPLSEIREKNTKFKRIEKAHAAAGIKILAPGLDKAVAGAPFVSARSKKEIDAVKEDLLSEIQKLIIETDQSGVILKCDTLGSLEAVTSMVRSKSISIRSASIGDISHKDVMQAKSVLDSGDKLNAFILGFNVKIQDSVEKLAGENKVPVIIDRVVYKLIERFEEQIELKKREIELEKLKGLTWPAKIRILPGYVFRQSNPAIVGVEILAGKLKPRIALMNEEGKQIGEIKMIENEGEKLEEATSGNRVAVSIIGLTVGRQANEGDELYSDITEEDFRILKQKKELLSKAEIDTLKHIANIKRTEKDLWGM